MLATSANAIEYVADLPQCAACGSKGGNLVRRLGDLLYCGGNESGPGCAPTR